LSSKIAAVGKVIAWKTATKLPGSTFAQTGTAIVQADGIAPIIIKMPKLPQGLVAEEFTVTIDLPENKGMVADSSPNLTCGVSVTFDIHPAAIQFETEKQTIHRRENKSVQIPVIRSANLKGRVRIETTFYINTKNGNF